MVEAQIQNWVMVFLSAILRKLQKSQADINSDAVLMVPFVGDVIAVSGVVVLFLRTSSDIQGLACF